MTVNETKEFLRSIRREQIEIAHLKQMIREEEAELLPRGIRYDLDKVQVSPDERFSQICAKVAEYQMELGESIAILTRKKLQAEQMIRKLDNENEREVLRWYYLSTDNGDLLSWRGVAIRMNYNERHIKRLHGYALTHMSEHSTL
mgnify:CR=1 FL=1